MKKNHELLVEIYNSISRSTAFYSLMTNEEITKKINQLLKKNLTITYLLTVIRSEWIFQVKINLCMVGIKIQKVILKLDQNLFNFGCQWSNVDKKIGGLEILKDSFKYDIRDYPYKR